MNEKEYDEHLEKMKQVGMVAFVDALDPSGFTPVFLSLLFKYGMSAENVSKMMEELGQLTKK